MNIPFFGKSKTPAVPEAGSREHAEAQLLASFEAYKLARRDRPRESFQPHGYSGDSAILGSSDLMNRRTRDLVRNTAHAKVIKRVLSDLVIGSGMQTFSWPFLSSELFEIVSEVDKISEGALGPRLQFALESDDLFGEYFSDKKKFDAEGRLSGHEMYRMLLGETITVGNGLLVRVFRKNFDPEKHLVPVCWQMFEREQLDLSKDRPRSADSNKIINGIEINEHNEVVAYHLFLDHPHDYFGVTQSVFQGSGASVASGSSVVVAAERVIDLALFDRPSSSMGASWLAASGQSIFDSDLYCDSELKSAAGDAAFLLTAMLEGGEKYGGDWGFEEGGNDAHPDDREFKLGHSPVAAILGKDEKVELHRPARPNRDAPHFLKYIDRQIASSAGVSYHSLTGDYESTSFSTTRAAKLDEEGMIVPIQEWFGRTVALPIRQTFNSMAGASGLIRSVSPAEFRRNLRTYQRFDVISQGRDLLDPFKEGEARTGRLRTMMSTFKRECARNNKHWIRELMQRAIEDRVFKMFDLDPDYTKAGNGPMQQGQVPNGSAAAAANAQADAIADRLSLLMDEN